MGKCQLSKRDKEHILTVLGAMLPYGVLIDVKLKYPDKELEVLRELNPKDEYATINHNYQCDEVRPYLRPMSSMTEEEVSWVNGYRRDLMNSGYGSVELYMSWYMQWLNSHFYDWYKDGNGKTLIEKGLAIAVTKENNPYEK